MIWTTADTWLLVVGITAAVCCALPGTFLVLRRVSLLGDAISHAVLPGLVAAFLLTGERSSLPMFIGAVVAGVLTALLTESVRRVGNVEEGASIGVVFTSLFAIGLILLHIYGRRIDLDPGCVLYGLIEGTPDDLVSILGFNVPRVLVPLAVVFALNAGVIALLFKELRLSSFDPALSTSLGVNAGVMHHLLMTLTAITAVAVFEAVGSIIVVAMLVVPAAAAHLLTDRLGRTVVLAAVIAAVAAALGQVSAVALPGLLDIRFGPDGTPIRSVGIAGSIAVASGVLLLLAFLFSPTHGLVVRLIDRKRLARRMAREDLLLSISRLEELQARPTFDSVADLTGDPKPAVERIAAECVRLGLIRVDAGTLALTELGRTTATQLLRSHRLWESYLADRAAVPADHTHATAHRLEHVDLAEKLDEELGRPAVDPQNKPIPRSES